MKTIGRIFIILLAVAVVSGVTVAIVNATGAGSNPNFAGRGGGFDRPGFVPGDRPDGFEGGFRPDRGGPEGGRFVVSRSLQMLIPLTVIVVVFLGIERLIDYLRVRRLARAKAQSE